MEINRNKKIRQLVIWGASGHARVIASMVRLNGLFNITGFLDDIDDSKHGTQFCGAPILGGKEQLDLFQSIGINHMVLGFGDCQARLTTALVVKQYNIELVSVIHPNAIIANDVTIGAGTVVMAGTVINPGSMIGENAIINTSSSIDHDCSIEDGVHIGPGVHVGGGSTIQRGTWIGIGATIKDKIKIGRGTIIGAGAVVIRDIPDGVVAYGAPAKVIRSVER